MKNETEIMTITKRNELHKARHPNDLNIRKEGKGVTWSKRTAKDKKLDEFYDTHVYTFVDAENISKKRWVRITGFVEEEVEEYLEKKVMIAQIVGEEE